VKPLSACEFVDVVCNLASAFIKGCDASLTQLQEGHVRDGGLRDLLPLPVPSHSGSPYKFQECQLHIAEKYGSSSLSEDSGRIVWSWLSKLVCCLNEKYAGQRSLVVRAEPLPAQRLAVSALFGRVWYLLCDLRPQVVLEDWSRRIPHWILRRGLCQGPQTELVAGVASFTGQRAVCLYRTH
jgi:hypothetical protein